MAAEDYFDPLDTLERDRDDMLQHWRRNPKMQRLYFRRDVGQRVFWTTGDGESMLVHDMEDSHVQNTLNYITRRSQQWELTRDLAKERSGVDVGEYIINGKPGREWFDIFVAEIKRRQS